MEKLTVAGSVVLKTQLNLDLVESLYPQLLAEFDALDPIYLRSGADKTPGPGYQWMKTITEIDDVVKLLLAEHYAVDVAKFTTTDSWLLLQTDEEWIDNQPHDHLGAGSLVVVAYIMADPATDSISFFDSAGNEEIVSIISVETTMVRIEESDYGFGKFLKDHRENIKLIPKEDMEMIEEMLRNKLPKENDIVGRMSDSVGQQSSHMWN
jgi:hypothetical protein